MRVSYSLLSSWGTCSLQAAYKYIYKLPSPSSSKSVFGNCVHAALEHYSKFGDVEQAVQLFISYWDDPSLLGLTIDQWTRRTTMGGLRESGIILLRQYDERMKREARRILATEYGFKVPIGDHEITGYVDLLEIRKQGPQDLITVVDFKTSSKKPYKEDLRYGIQFSCYDWASRQKEFWVGYPGDPDFTGLPNGGKLWEQYKDSPRKNIYWHLPSDSEIDAGERTDADFRRLYRLIDEVAKAKDAGIYVPNPSGDACGWCPYKEPCGIEIPVNIERENSEWF